MKGTRKFARAQTALAAVALPLLLSAAACAKPETFNGEVVEPAAPAPELAGVNWDGKPFRLSDLRGRVAVVFFGYTYCPDVCPFTLAKMKQLRSRLGDRAEDVEVVFVSVDPQRDTVEKLARYVPNFDRGFYGLHLEPAQVDATSKAFAVAVQYGQPQAGPETDSYYYVDHTGTFFVVDREGRLRLKFPPNATAEQMLPDIEKLLASPRPEATAELEVREARVSLVPGMGAVYLTVVNPGPQDRLLRVETGVTRRAELHESVEDAGVVRMVPHPEGFAVPAGGTLALAPGGKHVMLVAPRAPAGGADAIALTLHFERAGAVEVRAALAAPGEAHHGGHTAGHGEDSPP